MADQKPATDTINRHMIRGSSWMIGMRWTIRGVGLISTAILARLLSIEDFGIVAMAMLLIGLMEIFADLGVHNAIIREQQASRALYDTGFTIEMTAGLVLGAAIFLMAPLVGIYFDEPRVVPVVQVLALKPVLLGFENIGIAKFRKELDFGKDFRFAIYSRLGSFVIVIALAFLWRNYWALVAGNLAGAGMRLIVSYLMHPYRPRLSLAEKDVIWSFSRWHFLSRLGNYMSRRTDQFIIGGALGTQPMGQYFMAAEFSTMPTQELQAPLERGTYPVFAKVKDDPAQLASVATTTFGVIAILMAAIGFGVASVAESLTIVVLGDQWRPIIPLVAWFGVFGAVINVANSLSNLLFVTGNGRYTAIRSWIEVVVVALALTLTARLGGLTEIAAVRASLAVPILLLMIYLTARCTAVTLGSLVGVLWRPFCTAAVMLLVVRSVDASLAHGHAVELLVETVVGAATYTGVLLLLWLLSGRPDSPEASILRYLAAKLPMRRVAA